MRPARCAAGCKLKLCGAVAPCAHNPFPESSEPKANKIKTNNRERTNESFCIGTGAESAYISVDLASYELVGLKMGVSTIKCTVKPSTGRSTCRDSIFVTTYVDLDLDLETLDLHVHVPGTCINRHVDMCIEGLHHLTRNLMLLSLHLRE